MSAPVPVILPIALPQSATQKYDFAGLVAAADRNQAMSFEAGDDPKKTQGKIQAAVNNFRRANPDKVANITLSVKQVKHDGKDWIAVWAVPKNVAPEPLESGHPVADSKTNAASAI